MKKLHLIFAIALFFCIAVAAFAFSHNVVSNSDTRLKIPGNWSLSFHAYSGNEFKTLPVRLVGITSTLNNGLAVKNVVLQNRSSKEVDSIKMRWFLSNTKDKDKIVQQGETSFISIPKGVPSGTEQKLEFPVVAFADIYKPLLKDNSLNGDFRIDVAVSEVQFKDETSWKFGQSDAIQIVKVANKEAKGKPVNPCPNQTCQASGGNHYECVSSGGELCTNYGASCSSYICD